MTRTAEHPIDPQFLERWSPRAMDGTPLREAELFTLLEAARWAPSSGNAQPWRFLYALAGSHSFPLFVDLLVEGNQVWCRRAGALLLLASKSTLDNGGPSPTHSLDTGAAWMSLALQGSKMGLVVHGMRGFHVDRARAELKIPELYTIECMIAVGRHGRVEELPEALQQREQPNGRQPVSAFAFPASWPAES